MNLQLTNMLWTVSLATRVRAIAKRCSGTNNEEMYVAPFSSRPVLYFWIQTSICSHFLGRHKEIGWSYGGRRPGMNHIGGLAQTSLVNLHKLSLSWEMHLETFLAKHHPVNSTSKEPHNDDRGRGRGRDTGIQTPNMVRTTPDNMESRDNWTIKDRVPGLKQEMEM